LRKPQQAEPPPDLPAPDPKAFAIKEVIAREGQQIRSLCADRDVRDRLNPIPEPGAPRPLEGAAPERFGLCFSGGGIRSASVNLGLLQALAKNGFLRQAHYISGVSGGGYILGWLTAWTARVGFDAVEEQLAANSAWPNSQLPERAGFRRYLEPNPIHYLRRYVSYLVPRSGLGSGDTLAAGALYLRNVLLLQTMLAAAFIGVFALLQMAAPALIWKDLATGFGYRWFRIGGEVLLVLLAISVWSALGLLARNVDSKKRMFWATFARSFGFAFCVVLWLGLPAYVQSHPAESSALLKPSYWLAGFFLLELVVAYIQTIHFRSAEMLQGVRPQDTWWARVLAALGASGLGIAILHGFWCWLHAENQAVVSEYYVVLGLPAILLAASLVSFIQVGMFGDAFPDAKREWLGRFIGYFLYFGMIVGTVLFMAMFGPLCMEWLFKNPHAGWGSTALKWALPGGWIATTVGGLFAARSPATGGSNTKPVIGAIAAVAPPVFLLGLMLLLSWSTHSIAILFNSEEYVTFGKSVPVAATQSGSCTCCCPAAAAAPTPRWLMLPMSSADVLKGTTPFSSLGLLALISLGLAGLLGWRISVNEFSLHLFYRNRLVRTFLGASNINARTAVSTRMPDPFTGFTLDDDHYLGSLRQGKFNGPYPLWCTALNLTSGEDLAWQQRKASSFIYSPLFCGWDYMPSSTMRIKDRIKGNAYREVAACTDAGISNGEGYGGKGGAPLIGTAMAASGAAISPNWGYHTKPAVAALLALFNVRIGWWAGNPLHPKGYRKYAPGIGYFLAELLGSANEDKQYVYLSDGGHFENLGVYELVRRRVKYIIICDADADPKYEFGDLANAIEKCRVDFGVQIEMNDYSKIAANEKTKLSETHFAIGRIHYRPQSASEVANGADEGVLLYIKSSITGDEPAQVLGQRSAGSPFPHDTTLNQFFTETQFEAYRALGEHMGTVLDDQYLAFLSDNGITLPGPSDLTAEQRAEYVRNFFQFFLKPDRELKGH